MCTIKSIIKGPKLQQMSEGYCLCPAPAPLKMHWMDAHCSCSMPVCSEQAQVSLSLISGGVRGNKALLLSHTRRLTASKH